MLAHIEYPVNPAKLHHTQDKQAKQRPQSVLPLKKRQETFPRGLSHMVRTLWPEDIFFGFCSFYVKPLQRTQSLITTTVQEQPSRRRWEEETGKREKASTDGLDDERKTVRHGRIDVNGAIAGKVSSTDACNSHHLRNRDQHSSLSARGNFSYVSGQIFRISFTKRTEDYLVLTHSRSSARILHRCPPTLDPQETWLIWRLPLQA